MPEQAKSKIFYGWFIVAACFAITATLGETFFSFGVFFKPLEDEFGWSRTVVSASYITFLIGYSVSAAASGRLADKYPPRLILLASAALAGLGIALCRQTNNVHQLRFFLALAGLGSGATLSVPASIIQRWFYNRRHAGPALSVVLSGVGVGAMIFTPLINHFILAYGWRNAYMIVGILFFSIIAIAALIIRRSPMEISNAVAREKGAKPVVMQGWPPRKAVATIAFGSIMFIGSVVVIAFQTVSVHLIPLAIDLGISSTLAAAAVGLIGGLSAPGRLVSGFIADRISWQKTLVLGCAGQLSALVVLILLNSVTLLYVFVVIYGIFHGIRSVAQIGLLGEFFGPRSLGLLIGVQTAAANTVGAAGPVIAGSIYDTTGSYFIAFVIVAALMLSAVMVAALVKRPRPEPVMAGYTR